MKTPKKYHRNCHTHRLQTNQRHREEDIQNTIQLKQSDLSSSAMIAKLSLIQRTTLQNKEPRQKAREYDQKIPQSHTADQPTAP